jgi:hypothetical protein
MFAHHLWRMCFWVRCGFSICGGMATFMITLHTRDGGDGIRTLRAALKLLLRRFGLRAVKVEQTSDKD